MLSTVPRCVPFIGCILFSIAKKIVLFWTKEKGEKNGKYDDRDDDPRFCAFGSLFLLLFGRPTAR